MKKLLSFISVLSMLLSLGLSGISAMRAPIASGNVDLAENRNVKDVTLLQKYLAGICELTSLQKVVADTDDDGRITIKDATLIQKDLADIARIETDGFFPYMGLRSFYPDFSSGKAMSGVPVTFYTSSYAYDERSYPITYEFYVNGELAQERSEDSIFTYTFEEAGSYDITGKIYSKFDYSEEIYGYHDFVVVEPYESEAPFIKSIYCTKQNSAGCYFEIFYTEELTFVAEALNDNGEYEYAFLLNDILIQDFSEDNTCTYPFTEPEKHYEEHSLRVIVKDKNTDETSSASYNFLTTLPIPA